MSQFSTWPIDSRDEIGLLAKELSSVHFSVQVGLVGFHLQADWGESVADDTYFRLFRDLGHLTQVASNLRLALMDYRTTAKLPVVKPEEGEQP